MSNFKDFIGIGGGGGAGIDDIYPQGYGLGDTNGRNNAVDGDVIPMFGGGGGGGSIQMNQSFVSSGGAAGAVCQSELSLTSGTTYTITIGAGGNASGVGGNTTFVGSDIADMAANGGAGGGYVPVGGTTTKAGGTASGGNIANHTGGSAIIVATNGSGSYGGAACGFFETGKNSASSTSANMPNGAGMDIPPTDLIPQLAPDILGGSRGVSSTLSQGGTGDFGCGGGSGYIYVYSSSNSNYAYGGTGGIGGGGGGSAPNYFSNYRVSMSVERVLLSSSTYRKGELNEI